MSKSESGPDLWNSSAKSLSAGILGGIDPDRESFIDFVDRVSLGKFFWNDHHLKLARILQKCADGMITRLMVFMPPRHGKSELVSRLFPAYYLSLFPHRFVGLASYSAFLARDLSNSARDFYLENGGELDDSTAAKDFWKTPEGGGMWAVGRGGSATGKGGHCLITDDPLKDDKEADSPVILQGLIKWYRSTFKTRQMPPTDASGDVISDHLEIVIQTRWCEGDLCGELLDTEEDEFKAGEEGECENWHIVSMPAIAIDLEEEPHEFPASCTVEPDERKKGEALWPQRFSLRRLKRIKRNARAFWLPLYQQRPVAADGATLNATKFRIVTPERVPLIIRRAVAADLALTTKTTSDFTVALPGGLGIDGNFYLFNPYRDQAEAPDAEEGIIAITRKFRAQRLGIEAVAYQLSAVQRMKRRKELIGIRIEAIAVDRDKVARAKGWAPDLEDGIIYLVDDGSGWIKILKDECKKFPKGKHDDIVDAIGMLIALLRSFAGDKRALLGGKRDNPLAPR